MSRVCVTIEDSYRVTERQNLFVGINQKNSLLYCCVNGNRGGAWNIILMSAQGLREVE